MREFRFGFDELLNFPIKRFWFLVNQIDRLKAEDDMRHVQVGLSVGSEENLKSAFEVLRDEMGQVYVWNEKLTGDLKISTGVKVDPKTGLDPAFDRDGLQSLKSLGTL